MKRYSRRPFPTYRHRPGVTPHPERDPEGHSSASLERAARPLSALDWSANEDHLFAVDLYNAAYFWEAHAYWERLWALETTDPIVRSFLRGLIQLAAASLKKRDGVGEGERKLIERSRASLAELPLEGVRFGVDLEKIRESLDRGELPSFLELRLKKP